MADAKKCDRCGDYYDIQKFNIDPRAIVEIKCGSGYTKVDLCERCNRDLKDFLDNIYDPNARYEEAKRKIEDLLLNKEIENGQ